MAGAQFIVGVDLGTTHTVVASSSVQGDDDPVVFAIPQLVTAASSSSRPLLPSFLYAPLEGEGVRDAWLEEGAGPWVSGEFARRRGVEVPGRVVSSAKSWLSHAGVDRTAPILPWGGDDAAPKISPCEASAAYLTHVRKAWDDAHPDAPLAEQEVVLTLPASFDEAARELTVAAAVQAKLSVRLLEEPLAAFYEYRRRKGDRALAELVDAERPSALILVCDVGGGTTDLSLLKVTRASAPHAPLDVTRVAVGRHLLLGGDNMDLALAHACESRFGDTPLDPARFAQLVLACRAAKEQLLAPGAPDDVGVSVAGAGSRLLGGTLSARVTRADAETILLEGFFPRAPSLLEVPRARGGLLGFGLPYERDVAITRHVAAFFQRHAEGAVAPGALLLNGGVFHSSAFVERLVEAIDAWGGAPVVVLPNLDPDLAVARGAVDYGRARRGFGTTVSSGSARGYYVEVAGKARLPRAVVCVVPRGTAEGVRESADDTPLELLVGRPARFELFASDNARGHRAGEVLSFEDVELDPLPPVFASFQGSAQNEPSVRVVLQGELSAIGTLDLACVEREPPSGHEPRRFRLAFNLRPDASQATLRPRVAPASRAPTSRGRSWDEARVAIDRVFGKSARDVAPREAKDLVRELERSLGDRGQWDVELNRALFDAVFVGHKARRRSLDHERAFWQLTGYCLRPGAGDPSDAARVASLAKLLPDRLAFTEEPRGWQQFWHAWRRVAAGLDEASQTSLRDLVDPFLAPREAGRKPPKGWKPDALEEMLGMASSLERVSARRRVELGSWTIDRTWTERDPRLWAALGRLGARAPAYASASYVVPPGSVERWLDHLLREKWTEVPTASEAALRMSRVTGDRARDLPERLRKEVGKRLVAVGVGEELVKTVLEFVPVEEKEKAAFLGEGMPVGLRLVE